MTDLQALILLAVGRFGLHLLTNTQYGFHHDALLFLANGKFLDWGYVAYPPLTPFVGRLGLTLFGVSLVGIKGLAALAQSIALVITGLMANALGGGRRAQLLAALAAGIGLMSLLMGTLFQYITFDYLWWVVLLYFMIRLLKTDNLRWWLGVGACIGLGMMTKYTIGVLVVAVVVAVLATKLRHQLRSRWLWAGVGLSLLIFLPNLVWQVQHDFISLDFLQSISARDKGLGRADGFFTQQLYVNVNPLMLPLLAAGFAFFLRQEAKKYRPLLIIFVTTLLLFWALGGRFYYVAPLYPMLLAAGAVFWEQKLVAATVVSRKRLMALTSGLVVVGAAIGIALMLPVAPFESALWDVTSDVHDNFIDQIGWPQLVQTTAAVYEAEQGAFETLAILTSHYGSASAFHIYGERYQVPPAISPVNSFWLRGYGDPAPDAVLTIGFEMDELQRYFGQCRLAGVITDRYQNAKENSDIFLCQDPFGGWDTIWPLMQRFS